MKKDDHIICKNCNFWIEEIINRKLFTRNEMVSLHNPARVINVNFSVNMDDGLTKLVPGFRIQYNDKLGPTKGGLRMHAESDQEEVADLAFLMSLKTSLVNLPYGGAKGSIKINPSELSINEKERCIREYTRAISRFIDPKYDILAPDVNTGPQEMLWVRDEYEKIVGKDSPAIVTGKSVDHGGIIGRDTSTSRGGLYIIQEHIKNKMLFGKERVPKEITIAIQGFGNVGRHLAKFLHEEGYKVVAVSNSKNGIYNKDGLNISSLNNLTDSNEQKITNAELLELNVDMLIPAALGGVITKENANRIKANSIIELANGPITHEADIILQEKGIFIIPDILANSGGVIVSYFEWLQNLNGGKWDIEKVNSELKRHITDAYHSICLESNEKDLSLRIAAFSVAVKRILSN